MPVVSILCVFWFHKLNTSWGILSTITLHLGGCLKSFLFWGKLCEPFWQLWSFFLFVFFYSCIISIFLLGEDFNEQYSQQQHKFFFWSILLRLSVVQGGGESGFPWAPPVWPGLNQLPKLLEGGAAALPEQLSGKGDLHQRLNADHILHNAGKTWEKWRGMPQQQYNI